MGCGKLGSCPNVVLELLEGIGVAGTGRGCGNEGSCANVVLATLDDSIGVTEETESLQVVPRVQLLWLPSVNCPESRIDVPLVAASSGTADNPSTFDVAPLSLLRATRDTGLAELSEDSSSTGVESDGTTTDCGTCG